MLDESIIPKGDYCYKIDRIDFSDMSRPPKIKIHLCPYWMFMDMRTKEPYCTYCDHVGIAYDTILLEDQCKVCGVGVDEWQE